MTERNTDIGARLEEEGVPNLEDPINVDEGIMPPGETARFSDAVDVTAAGQRRGETLDERTRQEVPERWPGADPAPSPRLVEEEDDITATATADTAAPTAEEASVRERRKP